MNSPHNHSELAQIGKISFWKRHPLLRGFGLKFLPCQVTIVAGCVTILNYSEIRISIKIILLLLALGIEIVVYLIVVLVVFILGQRKRRIELEEEIKEREKEILYKNRIITLKDKEINFLKNLLHPDKQNDFGLIFQIVQSLDPKDPEHFENLLNSLWEFRAKILRRILKSVNKNA